MARPKALTRTPPTREEAEVAAAVVVAGERRPGVARMTITLTADAIAKIEERLYALTRTGVRVSTSAYIEAAVLESVDRPIKEDAAILSRRGASQRRRT